MSRFHCLAVFKIIKRTPFIGPNGCCGATVVVQLSSAANRTALKCYIFPPSRFGPVGWLCWQASVAHRRRSLPGVGTQQLTLALASITPLNRTLCPQVEDGPAPHLPP